MKPKSILLILAMLLCGCAGDEGGSDASYGDGEDGGIGRPQCDRRVMEDDVTNAREIGAHALSGGGYVNCGKIMRGGHLANLSVDGCQEFAGLGIETVIDLRMESERTQYSTPACVTDQATVINATLPRLNPSADNYVALLDETASLAAAFAALGESSSYPVYINCMIGRDRASTLTALVLMALGASDQTVVDEFDLNNDADVSVDTAYIQAVIDEVKARGGIETYLTSLGVTTAQLETLRSEVILD
jgi:protein-tyrosine phosphatase